ncbi:biotin/lipoyl-containing protein [Luteibacter sp. 22Crub2.1]|uniref:HlyD family secretion protein n=1 Tax=Luteibacter sp. 22Crub2.1 TaxID=1283288 RepID=UPI001591DC2F|nr:biotin/lipoyl-containing protein [Luteibacter sp. 22Crub2.1]
MSSYTQTTSVYGHVTGNDGITRLKAHQAGVVAKVKVKEGEKVSKGDLLFEITADRELGSKSSLASKISGEIGRRLAASETEMRANDALADLADREIKAKSVWMKKDLSRRREELALMHESIGVSENLLSRLRSAADEHLIPREQVDARKLDLNDRHAKYLLARRDVLRAEHELSVTEIELSRRRHQSEADKAESARLASTLRQESAEQSSRAADLITAPHDGIVTSITAALGQSVDSSSTLSLLSHLSDPTVLHLYVPGSAINHVSVGDTAVIEYESMNARKYGTATATITSVPRLPMSAGELTTITGGSPTSDPSQTGSLFFDVSAIPTNVAKAAGGIGSVPHGVKIKGILAMRTRKIYEWMLEPLIIAKGRQEAHGSE